MNHKDELVKLLGLEDGATDEVIANSIKTFQEEMVAYKNNLDTENATLKNSEMQALTRATAAEEKADNAETRAVAVEGERDILKNSVTKLTEELVNRDLEDYSAFITDQKAVREQLLSNRSGTISLLKGLKTSPNQPLHNSRTASQPSPSTGAEATVVDEATAQKISNRTRELQSTLKIGHLQAFRMAQGEIQTAGTK